MVNITVTDDNLPEDDKEFTVTGVTNQKYGQYRDHIPSVTFTIHDNDSKFYIILLELHDIDLHMLSAILV